MTLYDKAREFGEMIKNSEPAVKRADALKAFEQDEEALGLFNEYAALQKDVQDRLQNSELNQDDFKEASDQLMELGTALKEHPIAGAFIDSENALSELMNQLIEMVRLIVTGEELEQEGCGGNCSCGGCGGGCH